MRNIYLIKSALSIGVNNFNKYANTTVSENMVRNLIALQFGVRPEQVQPDTDLINDLGADELDLMELALDIGRLTGADVFGDRSAPTDDTLLYPEEVERFRTLNNIIQTVEQAAEAQPGAYSEATPEQLDQERQTFEDYSTAFREYGDPGDMIEALEDIDPFAWEQSNVRDYFKPEDLRIIENMPKAVYDEYISGADYWLRDWPHDYIEGQKATATPEQLEKIKQQFGRRLSDDYPSLGDLLRK